MLKEYSIREDKELSTNFSSRRGWFLVSKNSLELTSINLMSYMSNFLIVRAEFLYDKDAIEYYAVSELFDPIEDMYETPEYTFEVTSRGSGNLDIKVIRVVPETGKKLLRLLRKLDG